MKSEYKLTVGLEIHVELKTKTKMFCSCLNDPNEKETNTNICSVCTGQPGSLPVPNKEAIKNVLKFGVAVNGELADFTEFDRKNYFYPDIPKGYQISQYKYPLVKGGELAGVKLTRVHLEEDTGTSIHDQGDFSLVNYNRAGVPLMELVTEPVIESAQQAGDFARELKLVLNYLGIAEANMEKGEMRVEANISVNKKSKTKNQKLGLNQFKELIARTGLSHEPVLGTKVEVKNLNSFKSVEKAIEYEFQRQIDALENGEEIIQETRGWDENKQKTFSQRTKETSEDYRYFPEPDIPKFKISEIKEWSVDNLKKELPELPLQRQERYQKDFDIKPEQIEFLINEPLWGNYFENVVEVLDKESHQLVVNYITSDLIGLSQIDSTENAVQKIKPHDLAGLIKMIEAGKVSSRGAKDILKIMYEEKNDLANGQSINPEKIAEQKGLLQTSDEGELKKIAEKIISENQDAVEGYKNGKEASLQFLIGQGMKVTKGSSNPQILKKLFEEILRG